MFSSSLKKEARVGTVVRLESASVQSTDVDGLAYSAELGFLYTTYFTNSCEYLATAITQVKVILLEQTLCLMTNIDCGGKRCVMQLQPKCLGLPKCSVLV